MRKGLSFSDCYLDQKEKRRKRFEKKALKNKEWSFIVYYCLSDKSSQKNYLDTLARNPDYYSKVISYMNKKEEDLINWVKLRMPPHEIIWGDDKNIVRKIKERFDQIRNIKLNDWKPKIEIRKNQQGLESKLKNDSIQLEFDF